MALYSSPAWPQPVYGYQGGLQPEWEMDQAYALQQYEPPMPDLGQLPPMAPPIYDLAQPEPPPMTPELAAFNIAAPIVQRFVGGVPMLQQQFDQMQVDQADQQAPGTLRQQAIDTGAYNSPSGLSLAADWLTTPIEPVKDFWGDLGASTLGALNPYDIQVPIGATGATRRVGDPLEDAGRAIGETLGPSAPWEIAAAFTPGIGEVPGALSAARTGTKAALGTVPEALRTGLSLADEVMNPQLIYHVPRDLEGAESITKTGLRAGSALTDDPEVAEAYRIMFSNQSGQDVPILPFKAPEGAVTPESYYLRNSQDLPVYEPNPVERLIREEEGGIRIPRNPAPASEVWQRAPGKTLPPQHDDLQNVRKVQTGFGNEYRIDFEDGSRQTLYDLRGVKEAVAERGLPGYYVTDMTRPQRQGQILRVERASAPARAAPETLSTGVPSSPGVAAEAGPTTLDVPTQEANLRAAGVDVRDNTFGHMISPDGHGVDPLSRQHGIQNHWEVAVDAGLLPSRDLVSTGGLSANDVVDGLLKEGWIRRKDRGVWAIWDTDPATLRRLQQAVDESTLPREGRVYIDVRKTGESHSMPIKDFLEEAKGDVRQYFRLAEKKTSPWPTNPVDFSRYQSSGAQGGLPSSPPAPGQTLEDQLAASLRMLGEDPEAAQQAFKANNAAAAGRIAEDSAAKSQVFKESETLTKRAALLQGTTPAELRAKAKRTIIGALQDERGSVALADLPTDIKLRDETTALLGLPRTLKASLDLSAPGRQGLALAFRHPQEWAQSWAPMLRAWRSEEGLQQANQQVAQIMGKYADMFGDDAPADMIHFYDTGAGAEGLDRVPGFEAAGQGYISKAVRKIPGLENSERAYATFLNIQKAKTFDTMASALQRAGETDPEVYRHLGHIIDHATGWGAAPLKGKIEGQAFFSQRYMTSRFQFLTDPIVEGVLKGDWQTARAATENLVAFAGGMASILMLGDQTGVWDATLDPRSSDFGKIRVGPQRFDFGAGFLPLIRTAGRVATGEAKSVTGGEYDINRPGEVVKFLRNKLAPVPSEIVTRLEGKNAIGEEPADPLSLEFLRQMFLPLIADATIEAFQETGSPTRTALVAGSELVGGGTTAYGSGQVAQAEVAKERYGKDYDDLLASQQAEINAEIAESKVPLEWRNRQGAWWTARDDAMNRWQVDLGEEANDPFVQKALSMSNYTDIEPEMAEWARREYGIGREDAEKAVQRFLNATRLNDYLQAYRKEVLAADPGYLAAWDEAYEKGEAEYAPPKWARDFLKSQTPAGVGR